MKTIAFDKHIGARIRSQIEAGERFILLDPHGVAESVLGLDKGQLQQVPAKKALIQAVIAADHQAVKDLLDAGCDPWTRTFNGLSLLEVADRDEAMREIIQDAMRERDPGAFLEMWVSTD